MPEEGKLGGMNGELRKRAEALYPLRFPEIKGKGRRRTGQEIDCLLHELQVHQIELETQNEELRQSEAKIALEKAQFQDLYENAPVGFCRLDAEGRIVDANLALATLLGRPSQGLAGMPITSLIAPESQDLFYLSNKKILGGAKVAAFEVSLLPKVGEPVWVSVQPSFCVDSEGRGLCRMGFVDIGSRRKAELNLARSLAEKEILLREVHHRVKNNLSVISSLLNLQAAIIQTPENAMEAFKKTRDRIMAMALVHEELYKSEDYSQVDMGQYLNKLTRQLQDIWCPDGTVRLSFASGKVLLNVGKAIPCGLILNELITNAFKYAFPAGSCGDVSINFRPLDGGWVELSVADDGVGLPRDNQDLESHSLGITLVRLLVGQLEGSLEISTKAGTAFTIRFPAQGRD